jgi:hypothetical protein
MRAIGRYGDERKAEETNPTDTHRCGAPFSAFPRGQETVVAQQPIARHGRRTGCPEHHCARGAEQEAEDYCLHDRAVPWWRTIGPGPFIFISLATARRVRASENAPARIVA